MRSKWTADLSSLWLVWWCETGKPENTVGVPKFAARPPTPSFPTFHSTQFFWEILRPLPVKTQFFYREISPCPSQNHPHPQPTKNVPSSSVLLWFVPYWTDASHRRGGSSSHNQRSCTTTRIVRICWSSCIRLRVARIHASHLLRRVRTVIEETIFGSVRNGHHVIHSTSRTRTRLPLPVFLTVHRCFETGIIFRGHIQ